MINKMIIFIIGLLFSCSQSIVVNTIPKYECVIGDKEANWKKYNNARIEYRNQERSFYTYCVDSNNSDAFCHDMEQNLWNAEFRMLQRYAIHYNTCPLGY